MPHTPCFLLDWTGLGRDLFVSRSPSLSLKTKAQLSPTCGTLVRVRAAVLLKHLRGLSVSSDEESRCALFPCFSRGRAGQAFLLDSFVRRPDACYLFLGFLAEAGGADEPTAPKVVKGNRYSYPWVMQTQDGRIHVGYTYRRQVRGHVHHCATPWMHDRFFCSLSRKMLCSNHGSLATLEGVVCPMMLAHLGILIACPGHEICCD